MTSVMRPSVFRPLPGSYPALPGSTRLHCAPRFNHAHQRRLFSFDR
jgi:hypothetical protein